MSASLFRWTAVMTLQAVLLSSPTTALAAGKDGLFVVWDRIEGITPSTNVAAQTISGITPVGFPWTVDFGSVHINLLNGQYRFSVRGLAIGAMPTLLSPIGTTGVVASVKGTFVCADGGAIVDTPSRELTPDGNAFVKGTLDMEFLCAPEDVMFLVRVATVIDGAPDITDSWLAYGAARRFQGRKD